MDYFQTNGLWSHMNEHLTFYKNFGQLGALSQSIYINGYLFPLLSQMRTKNQLKKSKCQMANPVQFSDSENIRQGQKLLLGLRR